MVEVEKNFVSQCHNHTPFVILRFIEAIGDFQQIRAQRSYVRAAILLVRKRVIEDKDEAEVTRRVDMVQVDRQIFKREKRFELEAKHIWIVRRVDVRDLKQLHIHHSKRVVFHDRVKARGVVHRLWLVRSTPVIIKVHVK